LSKASFDDAKTFRLSLSRVFKQALN